MTIQDALAEVITQLEQGDVATRRQAVRQAVAVLQRPDCAEPCRDNIIAALRAAAEQDSAITVRDLARAALTDLPPQPTRSLLPDDRQHMLGVRCRNGHVTHFDRRRLCTDKTSFVRTTLRGDEGGELDELLVHCGECDAEVKVRVDCGGY